MWRDDAYLLDMLLGALKAIEFSRNLTAESFAASEVYQNAILHVLQRVGEAATKVSPQFKEEHPEIKWVKIIGLRHRLVHDYGRIDLQKVWEGVQTAVPELIEQLVVLVPPEEED